MLKFCEDYLMGEAEKSSEADFGVEVGRVPYSGISKRYFPFPEILNFGEDTSTIFVTDLFLSSQIAVNGLQKREWIGNFLSLSNVKRRGGEFFLNIRPVEKTETGLTFIDLFFLRSLYVNFFKTTFPFPQISI